MNHVLASVFLEDDLREERNTHLRRLIRLFPFRHRMFAR